MRWLNLYTRMTDKNYKKLLNDSRDYLYNQCDILKIDFAAKLGKVIGVVLLGLILTLIVLIMLVFLSMALAQLMSLIMPPVLAYSIIGAVYLLLVILLVACREKFIFRPLTAVVAGILLDGEVDGSTLDKELERLKTNNNLKEEQINKDIADIRQELEQPYTLFSIAKHIPTVISVLTTVVPLIRKMKKK